MITASEPLEFIPRGRQAVEAHPGPSNDQGKTSSGGQQSGHQSDNFLLHRLENISLTSSHSLAEHWHVREVFETIPPSRNPASDTNSFLLPVYTNNEDELYVRGQTAVWSSGIPLDNDSSTCTPFKSFSMDAPIKFAFFCPRNFIRQNAKFRRYDASNEKKSSFTVGGDTPESGICLVDSTSIRTYLSNGEDFLSCLEFPVQDIWPLNSCVLFERDATTTTIEQRAIAMPRLFSLRHPLEEMSPVLIKYNDYLGYLAHSEHRIIFCDEQLDYVLLYDLKNGRHFVTKLRKATEDEINYVGESSEQNSEYFGNATTSHLIPPGAGGSFLHHQSQRAAHNQTNKRLHQTNTWQPSNKTFHQSGSFHGGATTPQGMNKSTARIMSPLVSHSINAGNISKAIQSPLTRLHSSIRHNSFSMQDARNYGQAEPAQPIYPEFCLDTIWTETVQVDRMLEPASKGFYHTDWIGKRYLCYLLPRQGKLFLVEMDKSGGGVGQGAIEVIEAKEAICLPKMNLIIALDACGTLVLYSGSQFVGKVHIGGVLSNLATSENFSSHFPKRSSLLPTAPAESDFEHHDLHMLSPVTPVLNYQKSIFMSKSSGFCMGLRDPAGNRCTLICQHNKMYRITLPGICDSALVSRCLVMLRSVLPSILAVQLIAKWYGIRNAPGASDLSPRQEWKLFRNVLLELMGRPGDQDSDGKGVLGLLGSATDEPKRRRRDEDCHNATDADWEFLLAVTAGGKGIHSLSSLTSPENTLEHKSYNQSAILFEKLPLIFYSLHLLYEDLKLDVSFSNSVPLIAELLHKLSWDMKLIDYTEHYIFDCPELAKKDKASPKAILPETALAKLNDFEYFLGPQRRPPNVFQFINEVILDADAIVTQRFPYISSVNLQSGKVVKFVQKYYGKRRIMILEKIHSASELDTDSVPMDTMETATEVNIQKKVTKKDIPSNPYANLTIEMIKNFPYAIKMLFMLVLERDRENPPLNLPGSAYNLMMRPDLVSHSRYNKPAECDRTLDDPHSVDTSLTLRKSPAKSQDPDLAHASGEKEAPEIDDGMLNIDTKLLRLRFPTDLRIQEVRRLLDSATPVTIDIVQGPSVTDHDFIEEKEKQLFSLCTRTMALPVGRGMFTLRTAEQMAGDAMPIPKLCLTGKEVTKGAVVELSQMEVMPNMNAWPLFHNGVSAGLKISPDQKDVDTTWIVYNKPKMEVSPEHSGFLMALGLNGHLKSLSFMSIYDYLVRCDEMTSIGLLLGISAAHRGTQDAAITKVLSVHVEALLPPTALELEIQQNVQIASLMGIGLLYQGSAKRHIAEVLLQEIGRPPGPEMENCVERESYALTAGLALGMVTLGLGETPTALQDLQLADTLHYYMVGGNKRPIAGAQKEKYKLPSFQIREGDAVNIDVTGPGATLCLGLMFFQTENRAVANWMMPPDTKYLLDFVRPDLLLLRIIAKGLILWNEIEPTSEWLNSQIPEILKFDLKRGPPVDETKFMDDEAVCQAYCNIITGAAFTIGLKYAGTEDERAYRTLRKVFDTFMAMGGQFIGEYAGKTCVESCLILIVLSMSLVFAGSGNLEVVRIVRAMRSRIGPLNSHVTYGSHLAWHMALGFLFLGAGRFTLSRSPTAIAALVCALFPKFPIHSNDNRYHLQAFRHLYVLAVEARLFLPRDIDTGRLALCQLSCVRLNSQLVEGLRNAPCMLPELESLQTVIVSDPHFWPVTFDRNKNWEQFRRILQGSHCIDLKKRTGCLSLADDPNRLNRAMVPKEQDTEWHITRKMIDLFGKDDFVSTFAKTFLLTTSNEEDTVNCKVAEEQQRNTLLVHQFYNRLAMDCLESLPIYVAHLTNVQQFVDKRFGQSNAIQVWQLKLLGALLVMRPKVLKENPTEMIRALQMKLEMMLKDLREQDGEFAEQLDQSRRMNKNEWVNWLGTLDQTHINRLLFARQFQERNEEGINMNSTGGAFVAQLLDLMKSY